MQSARLGLPGTRENVVKLNADHSGVCRFGNSQTDQDNEKLVRRNVIDIYKKAIKESESDTNPAIADKEDESTTEVLQRRFAALAERP
jgi:hypothetical protein